MMAETKGNSEEKDETMRKYQKKSITQKFTDRF